MRALYSYDLALDVGTSSMRATTADGRVHKVRSRTENAAALAQGVVSNPDAAVSVLKSLFKNLQTSPFARCRALACVPSDADSIERAELRKCILRSGASSVLIVPEPMAAAVGAGIDVASRYSKLIVDLGEGVTDCALLHEGRVEVSHAVRVGCSDLRRDMRVWAARYSGKMVSEEAADALLRQAGVAPDERMPESLAPWTTNARGALAEPFDRMLDAVKQMIRELPASFGAEVIEDGIFLTGGGALLPGMRSAIESATGIHVNVVESPLTSVIQGARAMLPFAASLKLWK
jgi:rod shape-determining protein MreB